MSEIAPCVASDTERRSCGLLAADPFRTVRYHFGQLLGVDDFETDQAYHRGKQWLHNGWLHGYGAVWGLDVTIPKDDQGDLVGEVRVESGLALDAAGHELFLQKPVCVHVGRWLTERNKRFLANPGDPDGVDVPQDAIHFGPFTAHVRISFDSCLSRPVPAITEPCEGSSPDTAYSRVEETVRIELVHGGPPEPSEAPYHRLRLLFGLDEPRMEDGAVIDADQEVVDELDQIRALAVGDRPAAFLEAFRTFAAYDSVDLGPRGNGQPPSPFFPTSGTPYIVLAVIQDIELHRNSADEPWRLASAGAAETDVRRVLVDTWTIQELLNGPACGPSADGGGGGGQPPGNGPGVLAPPAADAQGPRIDPGTVEQPDTETITFTLDRRAMKASVEHGGGILVSSFDGSDGWVEEAIKSVDYDAPAGRVTVALKDRPTGNLVRLIVRGTGATPLIRRVGDRYVPLAGAVGGPPGGVSDGHDFVHMFKVGS